MSKTFDQYFEDLTRKTEVSKSMTAYSLIGEYVEKNLEKMGFAIEDKAVKRVYKTDDSVEFQWIGDPWNCGHTLTNISYQGDMDIVQVVAILAAVAYHIAGRYSMTLMFSGLLDTHELNGLNDPLVAITVSNGVTFINTRRV